MANLALSFLKLASVNFSTLVVQTNSYSTCKLNFLPALILFANSAVFFFSLEILAFFMMTGIFSTLLLPETKGQSLEELSNEDQDNFVSGQS